MPTIELSLEQEEIVNKANPIENKHSLIVVDAVPGSGKTSVVLSIAKQYHKFSTWCFTFNNQLAAEVQDKITEKELEDHTNVSTYHGFGKTYYNSDMVDDSVMFHVIDTKQPKIRDLPFIDILVIDETQDMKPLYFFFIKKVIADLPVKPSIILTLGDKRQNIYDFMGSDMRFLTMAHHLYPSMHPIHLQLTESFRLTTEIATFLNKTVKNLKKEKKEKKELVSKTQIVARRSNKFKPCYIVGNPYTSFEFLLDQILDVEFAKPDDLFFLFPSVRGTHVRILENKLTERRIRCVVSRSESGMLDDKVIKGKAVISTFHQSKGRERPIVVVFGADISYFQYYARDMEETEIPPAMYVALTRASEKLYIVQGSKQEPLPFFDMKKVSKYADVINLNPDDKPFPSASSSIKLEHFTSPSKIVEFIPQETMLQISLLFEKVFTLECEKHVEVKYENTVLGADKLTFEDVADLNGIAIPFKFETERKNNKIENTVIMKRCDEKLKSMFPSMRKYYLEKMKVYLESGRSNPNCDFFFYANMYRSLTTGYRYFLEQLDKYDYALDVLEKLMNNLRRHIRKQELDVMAFEVPLMIDQVKVDEFLDTNFGLDQIGRVLFRGAELDMADSTNVYEIKCVEILQNEHKLQLVVYAWLEILSSPKTQKIKNYFLLNARNGQLWKLDATKTSVLDEIMVLLFRGKYLYREEKVHDRLFIEKHLSDF